MTLAALGGCAGNNKAALVEALRTYNDGVRWQRSAEVAAYLDAKLRAGFIRNMGRRQDVQVSDCRIRNVQLKGDSRAFALVSIDWYSLRTARAYQTLMLQSWQRDDDGKWRVSAQRWVRGPTFPLFAAAAPRAREARPGASASHP
jgi:hypothetical protein